MLDWAKRFYSAVKQTVADWWKHLFDPGQPFGPLLHDPIALHLHEPMTPQEVSALDPMVRIEQPFPSWVQKLIRNWQSAGWVHPLTCAICPSEEPMNVTPWGMKCEECGFMQGSVPAICLQVPDFPDLSNHRQ